MASDVRAPSLRVTLDGIDLPGATAADISSNNHFAADRFHVQFAAQALPEAVLHIPGQQLEILVGLHGLWRSLLIGSADAVRYDPTIGLVEVEGRDLSSLLIDTQTDETFANRTASEIATILAGRHELGALVDPTATAVGRYYQSEHDHVTLGRFAKTTTEWDLLAFLASREGYDLFMDGATLRFGAPAIDNIKVLTPGDCTKLQLEHCVGLARPITVTVKSWNTRSADVTISAVSSAGLGQPSLRTITRPNLTPDSAQRLAEQSINDLKRHEWAASVLMPGELALTPRSQVVIAATGTAWDRRYRISEITRHLDFKRGFTQRLSLQGIS